MPAVPPARQDPTPDPDITPPDQKPGSERQPDCRIASQRLSPNRSYWSTRERPLPGPRSEMERIGPRGQLRGKPRPNHAFQSLRLKWHGYERLVR